MESTSLPLTSFILIRNDDVNKQITVLESVLEFYKMFTPTIARKTEIISEGLCKIQLPLYGGMALGVINMVHDYGIYKTFVSNLFPDQVDHIETDRELNDTIQNMNHFEYKLLAGVLKS